MPARIDEKTRRQVIKEWLSGGTRDEVAATCGVGTGTVTGIIKEWQDSLNDTEYGAVREIAIDIKKKNLSFVDAANVLRLYNLARTHSIKPESVEDFIKDIQDVCNEDDLSAREIVATSSQLLVLAKHLDLAPQQIPEVLSQKAQELKSAREQLDLVLKEKNQADGARLEALKQKEITQEAIQEYIDLREALKDHGVSTTEVKKILTLLDSCKELSYNPKVIASKLSVLTDIEKTINELINKVKDLEKQKVALDIEVHDGQLFIDGLKTQLAHHWPILTSIDNLKANGVKDHNIIAFAEILSRYESELNMEKLLDELKQYKTIAALIEALTSRIIELKRHEATLAEAVNMYARIFNEYEAKIKVLYSVGQSLTASPAAQKIESAKEEPKTVD